MTAIGAVPAGGVTPPTAAEMDALTTAEIGAWTPDVWQWITGPYTGSTPVPVLQWRALALIGRAARAESLGVAMPGVQVVEPPERTVAEPHSPAGVVAANGTLPPGYDPYGTGDGSYPEPDPVAVGDPVGTLSSSYVETSDGGTGAPGFAPGPAPGSVDDPAYSSPTPVAGERIEPADQPGPDAPGEGQQPVPESPPQP